jgi:hypothetical protein
MRSYKTPFGTPAAFTASFDFLELTPADDKPIVLLRFNCFNTTDLGDAAEEMLKTTVVRGNTVSGSGGTTAANGNSANPSDATSGFTFEALNSTKSNTGTTKELAQIGWNVRIPMDFVYLPEERDEAGQGNTLLCWRCDSTPADSITVGGGATVGENG